MIAQESETQLPSRGELLGRARSWESKLLDGPITYYPVRHHSPACAIHLSRWIDEVRPDAIIVEGPPSLDRWIPMLVRDDCVGPVAILTTYRESESLSAARHSAFFPLCDYSPEWVAIRKGKAIGARVRFADLEFHQKVRLQREAFEADTEEPRESDESPSMLGVLLADEANLRHSAFINGLVRRLGCRDFDELWDHLFESRAEAMSTGELVGLMATYCDLSRASHDHATLRFDATLAREAVMVDVVRAEFKRLKKPTRRGAILVVTGGFHTVALADAVDSKGNPHRTDLKPPKPGLCGSWLIRYSYDQLDALCGYRSGMPSPGFYDALWQADRSEADRRSAVARLISTIARQTRGKPIPHEASVTDSIAAVQMLDRLADLRGHSAPTRSDLLDAIAACMRKENAAGNDLLASITHKILAGDRVGMIPTEAGQPPIVDYFQRLTKQLRLPSGTIEPRGVNLDLYRKPEHRRTSFLFHQLQLLDVPYASFVDGPDFIHAHRLGKRNEEWSVAWTPSTEARLAECASMGDTVPAAAVTQVIHLIRAMDEDGAGRNADMAVDLLIRTCRAGLHEHASRVIDVVQHHVSEDGAFASVAGGLSRLNLLLTARQTLEADRVAGIPELISLAYHRAVFLVDSLRTVPDDQLDASLDGLLSLRELLTTTPEDRNDSLGASPIELDETLFVDSLKSLTDPHAEPPRSEVAGCAAGLLYGFGQIDEETVCGVVARYLDAAVEDVGDACGVVRGLMMSARESFWQMDELLKRIDALFQRWEDQRFNNALPHLRLAFSGLAPREVDSVAARVARLHRVDDLGPLIHPDITEEDMQLALRCADVMNRSLSGDGLQ